MDKLFKFLLGFLVVATVAFAAFAGGFVTARFVPAFAMPNLTSSDKGLGDKVEEVQRVLARSALNPPDETSVTVGAINGLLEGSGDSYATYFDERHFQFFTEQNEGEFGGIGVTIAEREGAAYVVSLIDGTPAQEAGIQAGDVFVSIDGVTRDKWTSEEVVKRVRGEEGSVVTLEMQREEVEELLTFDIERAMIAFPNVDSELLDGDVGYIRLLSFNQKSAEDLSEAIESLRSEGARGFIVDVRDNPGGLLSEAVEVSSLFVSDGVIVRVDERGKPQVEHRALRRETLDEPVVLLVNGNSASASEIVAGALQDYDRATLVGEKTFGKGSVQTVEQLSFGGAMKFTIAHYLTPKSRIIDGQGLEPDVVVEMEHGLQAERETDTQLQEALRVAQEKL